MISARYPYLFALHDAPGIPGERRSALAEFAAELLERTGCRALFDVRRGGLYVHLAHDITQGLDLPPMLTVLRHRSGWDWGVLEKLDEMCRVIRSARVSWRVRDFIDGYRSKARENAGRQQTRQEVADMAVEIRDVYEYTKVALGMGTHHRRSFLVDGHKGR